MLNNIRGGKGGVLNSAFFVIKNNYKSILLGGLGLYFLYKFNKKTSTDFNNTLSNQSLMSDAEIYSIIDEIISAVNSFLGTDETNLYNAINYLTSADWAKVNKLYGKKGYSSMYGQVSTDLIDDLVFQHMDLRSMLKNELSNNQNDDIYLLVKELYNSINVSF